MDTELNTTEQTDRKMKMNPQGGSSNSVYGLGLMGAWFYYFRGVTTFQEGVKAFFKGLFWPAFLVYALLEYLDQE